MLRCPSVRTHPCLLNKRGRLTYLIICCPPGDVCRTHAPLLVTWLFPLAEAPRPPLSCLQNGAAMGWTPPPDSMPDPDLETMCTLLAEHLKLLKGCAFSGLDMVATPFLKYTEGHDFYGVPVLSPFLAQLSLLCFKSAHFPADWYKKGPMLDPKSNRMLVVSGTMYGLYANVNLYLLTTWCTSKSKIPDAQFGFYPGRNTLQPMFILGTCSMLPAPLSQASLASCIPPSLFSNRPTTQSLERLMVSFSPHMHACISPFYSSKPACW